MRKRINIAKAKYAENTKHRLTNNQLSEILWPDMAKNVRRVTFQNILKEPTKDKKPRKLSYTEMVALANALKCTPNYLIGSEKYSFVK